MQVGDENVAKSNKVEGGGRKLARYPRGYAHVCVQVRQRPPIGVLTVGWGLENGGECKRSTTFVGLDAIRRGPAKAKRKAGGGKLPRHQEGECLCARGRSVARGVNPAEGGERTQGRTAPEGTSKSALNVEATAEVC